MNPSSNYFHLIQESIRNDYRISLNSDDPNDKEDLAKAKQEKILISAKLNTLIAELSQENLTADEVRIGMIGVSNIIQEYLTYSKDHPGLFPDLNQGMIIPGYLFAKILNYYKDVVIFEGGTPSIQIYISKEKWDFSDLSIRINEIREVLELGHFSTLMDGIQFYKQIEASVFMVIEEQRTLNVI